MVLVYLKNLFFQSPNRRKDPVPKKLPGTLPKFSIPTYGSIAVNSPGSPDISPGSASNEATASHVDVEQAFGLNYDDNTAIASADDISDNDSSDTSSTRSNNSCFKFSPRVISDAIIGLSDGLTVPFALTAGLSTFNDTRVVVYGGVAELIAGSISMGLGGWLAARGECEYYHSTVAHTASLIATFHAQASLQSSPTAVHFEPSPIPRQVNDIFESYSLPPALHSALVKHILSPRYPRQRLLSLLIRQHHNLSPPEHYRAHISALTIAGGYFFGGFVPLLPYFFVGREEVLRGLVWSIGVMAICLFFFGAWKTVAMDNEGSEPEQEDESEISSLLGSVRRGSSRGQKVKKALRGAVEMVMVGGVAAGGAMGIVRFLGSIGE